MSVATYRLKVSVHRVSDLAALSLTPRCSLRFSFWRFPPQIFRPTAPAAVGATELTFNRTKTFDFYLSSDDWNLCLSNGLHLEAQVLNDDSSDVIASAVVPVDLLSSDKEKADGVAQAATRGYRLSDAAGAAQLASGIIVIDASIMTLQHHTVAHAPGAVTTTAGAGAGAGVHAPPGADLGARRSLAGAIGAAAGMRQPLIVKVNVGHALGGKQQTTSNELQTQTSILKDESAVLSPSHRRSAPNSARGVRGDKSSTGPPVKSSEVLAGSVAEFGSLLHLLQYDVAYQLKSNCDALRALLKREHGRLNGVNAPAALSFGVAEQAEKTAAGVKNDPKATAPQKATNAYLAKLRDNVAAIVRKMNITTQLCAQVAAGSSSASAQQGDAGQATERVVADPLEKNDLPMPSDGTVAEMLQFDVLYQLQGLAALVSHTVAFQRQKLEVPLEKLPKQHQEIFVSLALDLKDLTRNINVVVQSCVDGTLESRTKLEKRAESTGRKSSHGGDYSDDLEDDSSIDDRTTPRAQVPVARRSIVSPNGPTMRTPSAPNSGRVVRSSITGIPVAQPSPVRVSQSGDLSVLGLSGINSSAAVPVAVIPGSPN